MQNKIYSLLFEKEDNPEKKKRIVKKNLERNIHRKFFSEKVSQKCSSLLSNIYDKILNIKDKSHKLNKLNSISLQNISKNYYRINTAKTSLSNIIRNNDLMTLNATQSTNNDNVSSKKSIYSTIITNKKRAIYQKNKLRKKKKKIKILETNQFIDSNNNFNFNFIPKKKRIVSSLPKNWKKEEKLEKFANIDINKIYKSKDNKKINVERFNDEFRIEMNNTFFNYDPKKHLKQINDKQRDNMSLRKNMEAIKKSTNDKIECLCKNKKNIVKINNKIKRLKGCIKVISARNLPSLPEKIPFNINFKTQKKLFPFGYKIRALYSHQTRSIENEKKVQNLKRNFSKEKNIQILKNNNEDLIDKTFKKIYITLDTKNIEKYINTIKNEKVDKEEETTEIRKNKFFPLLKEVKEYMENNGIKNDKYIYNNNEKEDIQLCMVDLENKLLKDMNDNKKKFLKY